MKKKWLLFILLTGLLIDPTMGQSEYEPSAVYPFGRAHPDAPGAIKDFGSLIGICDCESVQRSPKGEWGDTVQTVWKFKYILNGKAIQDETWKADGRHSSSIRQYNPDSSLWYVTFFATNFANPKPSTWEGGKQGENIVLKLPQKAPNGMDGFSQLTFYEISSVGFRWKGEWVNPDQSIVYPFWTIDCKKRSP